MCLYSCMESVLKLHDLNMRGSGRIVENRNQVSCMKILTRNADLSRSASLTENRELPAEIYFLAVHLSTHSFTVLYQSCEFCGFSTQ
jgi:hypothetical protein